MKKWEVPVALAEDQGSQLISSAAYCWSFLLKAKRSATAHAFPAASLVSSRSNSVQAVRGIARAAEIESGSLPPMIGWMWGVWAKKRHLFFLDDIHRGQPETGFSPQAGTESRPASLPIDFGRAFRRGLQPDQRAERRNTTSRASLIWRRVLLIPRERFRTPSVAQNCASRVASTLSRRGGTARPQPRGAARPASSRMDRCCSMFPGKLRDCSVSGPFWIAFRYFGSQSIAKPLHEVVEFRVGFRSETTPVIPCPSLGPRNDMITLT